MPCSLLAVQVYDWLKYGNARLVSVSTDLVMVSMVSVLVALMVPLITLLHSMMGAGTPMATQVNVTLPPSRTTAGCGDTVIIGMAMIIKHVVSM